MWEEGHWTGPDYDAAGKKKSIQPWRIDRPHMRAFHFSWISFLMCFIMWFAIPPLMPTIKKPKCLEATSPTCVSCMTDFASDLLAMGKDAVCKVCAPRDTRNNAGCGGLGLVQSQIVLSNATSVMGTIIIRILIGSLADGIGVRWSYIGLLTICSIPGFCVSAVQTVDQFIALRFLISFVGGSFVLTQLWTSVMFSASIVGTANATTAGWGNLGGGIALAVMPKVFQSLIDSGFDNEYAWRYTLIWPPAVLLALAVGIYFLTDDTPVGRYSEQRAKIKAMKADPNYIDDGKDTGGEEPASIAARSLQLAAVNWRTWVLFIAYAFSFGVEVAVYSNIALYFNQSFSLNQADSGLAGSLFGLFNLFARTLGGMTSDLCNKYMGVRGRLWSQFCCAFLMGIFLLVFSSMTKDANGLGGALGALCAWALFLTMTEGTVYGIVPFIEPTAVGGVAGIVGAGGNAGALSCNFLMSIGQRPAFMAIGWISLWSAILIPLIWIPGVGSMFRSDTVDHKAHVFTGMSATPEEPAKAKEIDLATPSMHYNKSMPYPGYPPSMPMPMMPPGHSGNMMPYAHPYAAAPGFPQDGSLSFYGVHSGMGQLGSNFGGRPF